MAEESAELCELYRFFCNLQIACFKCDFSHSEATCV